jgi:hypothetical protein
LFELALETRECAAQVVGIKDVGVLFQLVEELREKLSYSVVSFWAVFFVCRKSFEHSDALILVEGAHLAHPVYLFEHLNRSGAETHEAGDNHTDVRPQVRIEILVDLSLDLHHLALINIVAFNREVLVTLGKDAEN